ncbi:MAG: glycosyltransferase family 4 protein [Thermoguttaceae bacterium]
MFPAFLFAFIVPLVLSYFTGFLVRRLGPKCGLIDKPGHRKIHTSPVTTGGGLAIWFGVIFTFAVAQIGLFVLHFSGVKESLGSRLPDFLTAHFDGLYVQSAKMWILLGLGSTLVLLGTLDDRFNLSWKIRIFVQTIVAIFAVCCGFKATLFLSFPFLANFLSVIWIVMLINSFNMLDNMNGLSSGVAAICATFLAAVMLTSPNPTTNEPQLFIGGFLLVLAGAICGFLGHNNPFRAKMFMGDGGAYFIGFLLATMTLTATYTSYGAVAKQTIFVPVLILAVPVYDTVTVVFIRLREKRSPFEGDKRHFSHRLVDRGFTTTQAVFTIYLATAVCALGALLLYRVDFTGAVLVFSQVLLVLVLIGILEGR